MDGEKKKIIINDVRAFIAVGLFLSERLVKKDGKFMFKDDDGELKDVKTINYGDTVFELIEEKEV